MTTRGGGLEAGVVGVVAGGKADACLDPSLSEDGSDLGLKRLRGDVNRAVDRPRDVGVGRDRREKRRQLLGSPAGRVVGLFQLNARITRVWLWKPLTP